MRPDTRTLLRTGSAIFLTGALAALLMLTALGGISRRQGPHTNGGWLALLVAIGCLPTGALTLSLGLLKLGGETFGQRKGRR